MSSERNLRECLMGMPPANTFVSNKYHKITTVSRLLQNINSLSLTWLISTWEQGQ